MSINLFLFLDNSNFKLLIQGLNTADYDVTVLLQKGKLKSVTVVIVFRKSIAGRKISC